MCNRLKFLTLRLYFCFVLTIINLCLIKVIGNLLPTFFESVLQAMAEFSFEFQPVRRVRLDKIFQHRKIGPRSEKCICPEYRRPLAYRVLPVDSKLVGLMKIMRI